MTMRMIVRGVSASVLSVALLLGGAAGAQPKAAKPAKGAKEKGPSPTQEAEELQKKIDQELQWFFSYQVEGATYRSRLKILQSEWHKLFGEMGTKEKPKQAKTLPPPLSGFRIDTVSANDGLSAETAQTTTGCKKRRGCRVWVWVSFAKDLVTKQAKFEISADLSSATGSSRYAVPAKELTAREGSMAIDLALDQLYIYKGKYTGTLKVLCEGRYLSKPFELELFDTF
ncbi:MAG: hypothetical protein IT371_28920 [Deltaproteobacteria bacterium]|nr:hypothetical protein [Deltaproteobacteria bacterium]